MKIHIEIDEVELRKLVLNHLASRLGDVPIQEKDIVIQVKSAKNYKAEWENAAFRAVLDKYTVD